MVTLRHRRILGENTICEGSSPHAGHAGAGLAQKVGPAWKYLGPKKPFLRFPLLSALRGCEMHYRPSTVACSRLSLTWDKCSQRFRGNARKQYAPAQTFSQSSAVREICMLRSTRRGLETRHGRDGVTLVSRGVLVGSRIGAPDVFVPGQGPRLVPSWWSSSCLPNCVCISANADAVSDERSRFAGAGARMVY